MLVDMEHAFDRKYAENLGIENTTLIHAKPDT
jgi:recA bacterial DNA recombination protein